jgi:hypothetical protein
LRTFPPEIAFQQRATATSQPARHLAHIPARKMSFEKLANSSNLHLNKKKRAK